MSLGTAFVWDRLSVLYDYSLFSIWTSFFNRSEEFHACQPSYRPTNPLLLSLIKELGSKDHKWLAIIQIMWGSTENIIQIFKLLFLWYFYYFIRPLLRLKSSYLWLLLKNQMQIRKFQYFKYSFDCLSYWIVRTCFTINKCRVD